MLLSWALTFLVAIAAGALGFGVLAGSAALVAKIVSASLLILILVAFLSGRRLA